MSNVSVTYNPSEESNWVTVCIALVTVAAVFFFMQASYVAFAARGLKLTKPQVGLQLLPGLLVVGVSAFVLLILSFSAPLFSFTGSVSTAFVSGGTSILGGVRFVQPGPDFSSTVWMRLERFCFPDACYDAHEHEGRPASLKYLRMEYNQNRELAICTAFAAFFTLSYLSHMLYALSQRRRLPCDGIWSEQEPQCCFCSATCGMLGAALAVLVAASFRGAPASRFVYLPQEQESSWTGKDKVGYYRAVPVQAHMGSTFLYAACGLTWCLLVLHCYLQRTVLFVSPPSTPSDAPPGPDVAARDNAAKTDNPLAAAQPRPAVAAAAGSDGSDAAVAGVPQHERPPGQPGRKARVLSPHPGTFSINPGLRH